MSHDSQFANHLFRLRRNRTMSQKRLAYLVGTSVRAISDYERGRRLPTLKIAMLLEIVLNAKVSEIYVDVYQDLGQNAVSREDAVLGSSDHQIRNRWFGKD
jgi:DNA-binding XRE family transcriptional regulator